MDLDREDSHRPHPRPALPELTHAPGVLLYDIESDPDARDDFLHGFLRLPRDPAGGWALKQARYHPLLTLQEQGEWPCWRRLERLLDRYGDWPVLHYGETESLALRRMAQRQGVGEAGQGGWASGPANRFAYGVLFCRICCGICIW